LFDHDPVVKRLLPVISTVSTGIVGGLMSAYARKHQTDACLEALRRTRSL
jgi:hypothetical protein